jgi:hypothetical protein
MRDIHSRLPIALGSVLLLGLLTSSIVNAKPLLETGTESPLQHEQAPPPALANYLWQHLDHDEQQLFKENCAEPGHTVQTSFRSALEYQQLPSIASREQLFFVRPTVSSWCIAFYGAHIFEFWLVAKNTQTQDYQTLLNDRVDSVTISDQATHQRYDVSVTNCTAASCANELLQFNGTTYQAKQCQLLTFDDHGKDITKDVACQQNPETK